MKMTVYLPDEAFERKDFKALVKDAVKERLHDSLYVQKILEQDKQFELSVDVKLTRK